MKRTVFTIVVVLAALSIQAQNVRLGISGGVNSTWLMNKNVFDQNDGLDIAASFGGRFGVEAIYSFSEKVGASVGLNFLSTNNQKYTGDKTGLDGDLTTKLNYIDIPVLFRLTSESGTYFELGPQIGILSSAKEDFSPNNPTFFNPNYKNKNVKGDFNGLNIAAILGFGVDIDVTDNIFISTGLRLGYGLSDVTKEYKEGDDTPEALTTLFAHFNDDGDIDYQKTSRVFGGLHLGLSYKFGGK